MPIRPEAQAASQARASTGSVVSFESSRSNVVEQNADGVVIGAADVARLITFDARARFPVGGAKVWSVGIGGESRLLGSTDDSGVLATVPQPGRIVILHPDYELTSLQMMPGAGSDREVFLEPGGVIRGRFVDDQFEPIRSGTRVIAFPGTAPPSKAQVSAALNAAEPRLHIAQADEDGAFELRSLERGRGYTLAAAGGGWVMPRRRQGVLAGGGVLDLELERLYGALAVLRGPDGQPPRTSKRLWALPGPRWYWEDQSTHGVGTDSIEGALLDIPSKWTSRSYDYEYLLLYWSEQSPKPERLGPVRFTGQLAGYEPCVAEVWLPLVDQGLRAVAIELEPTVDNWSSVEVRLVAPERTSVPGHVSGGVGHLVLKQLDSGLLVTHVLEDLRPGSIVFEGVPEGVYHLYLTTKYGYFNSADRDGPVLLQVGGADPRPVQIDISGLCSVTFGVTSQGQPYTGAFAVEVQGRNEPGSAFAHFDGPPYSLQGLRPGDYRFTVYTPEHVPSSDWVGVSMSAGEGPSVRVDIRLP